jgi:hypothetical protein
MKRVLCMLSFAGAVACSNDQTVEPPAPALTTDAGVPAPASPTRTVGHRSPFGDAFQADNLMVDGDFELTGRNDQAPWFAFDDNGQQTLDYETGGHCRSGIRCGTIGRNEELIGFFASPAKEEFEIRAYVKPDSGRCADVQIFVFEILSNITYGSAGATTIAPEGDGWCLFDGKVPAVVNAAPSLFIQLAANTKSKTVIVDQVSVLPVSKVPVHGITPPPQQQPSAETRKRIGTISAWVRAHRKYGRNVERETP